MYYEIFDKNCSNPQMKSRPATLIWCKIWMNVRKKSELTEKNLNLTTKIALLYRNFYQIHSQKHLNYESGYLNFTKFQEKNLNDSDKIWMNGRCGRVSPPRLTRAALCTFGTQPRHKPRTPLSFTICWKAWPVFFTLKIIKHKSHSQHQCLQHIDFMCWREKGKIERQGRKKKYGEMNRDMKLKTREKEESREGNSRWWKFLRRKEILAHLFM